jgi:hypothetical protein
MIVADPTLVKNVERRGSINIEVPQNFQILERTRLLLKLKMNQHFPCFASLNNEIYPLQKM